MIKNYLKVACRNLIHHKAFSLINILGLALGIAACMVIYVYVSYEQSYDTFNEHTENIYRLKNVRYYASGTDSSTGCVALLGPTLKEEIPEVVDYARVRKFSALVTVNNRYFNEKNIFWADPSFLTMFSFPLLSGNPNDALKERYRAVLTKETAQKYFGNQDAIGKTIKMDDDDFIITGVAENIPDNSHIKFNILCSYNTQFFDHGFCWGCNNNNTYIQVIPETKESTIESKLPLIVSKLHDRKKDGFDRAYFLQPLKDIHLYSNLRFEHEINGNAKTVGFLSLIAVIILLIAWINYINLSTARSIERAKEVGLRKVVGAGFWTLVRQFLLESFIINLIAVFISLAVVEITYPFWNEMIGLPASLSLWKDAHGVLLLALISLSPVVAGMYPAFVLSSYSPISILRGSFKNSLKGIFLKKGLVIFQFAISIVLIAMVIMFYRQLSFMRNKNLGFDSKQKLVVNGPYITNEGERKVSAYNTFINELRNKSLIDDATFSSVIPGMENNEGGGGFRTGGQTQEQGKQVNFVYIAQNYLDFFNIQLVCGRNFFGSELKGLYQNRYFADGLIINESAAKVFGFDSPEKAIGASIYSDNDNIGNVIGVIKDYHQQSLEKEIKPVIFEGVTSGNYFVFNISTENVSKKLAGIKTIFANIFPGNPFEYNFLDEFFDRQYKTDLQTAQMLSVFTFLSIFISCLGLIGLSSLMTTHRTKEIGIRKVLGASIQSLLSLLSREFIKWLLISNVVAWPLAYYFMNNWLQNFAYRIDISWWIFLAAGGIALVIALLTVSIQAVKAATANPVESLKYE